MLTGNRKLVHLTLSGNLALLKTAGTIGAAQDLSTISSWEAYGASSSRIECLSQLSRNQAVPNLESQGLMRILQLADDAIINWQEVLALLFFLTLPLRLSLFFLASPLRVPLFI